MILTKKHLAALTIILAVLGVFVGIGQSKIRQTIANHDVKIILDAGHDAYA